MVRSRHASYISHPSHLEFKVDLNQRAKGINVIQVSFHFVIQSAPTEGGIVMNLSRQSNANSVGIIVLVFVFLSGCATAPPPPPDVIEDSFLTNLGLKGKEKFLMQGVWGNSKASHYTPYDQGYFVLTDEAIYVFRGAPQDLTVWTVSFKPKEDLAQDRLLLVLNYADLTAAKVEKKLIGSNEVSVHQNSGGDNNLMTWSEDEKAVKLINDQIERHR